MQLKTQKRLAAHVMKCSEKRVIFDQDRLADIKEAITKTDIRSLVHDKVIKEKPLRSTSKAGARKNASQKRKGNQKGPGSRKGKKTARFPKKTAWMNKIRVQRRFLKELKEKDALSEKNYQMLYLKAKGGFFRSRRHIKLYIEEHELARKQKDQ